MRNQSDHASVRIFGEIGFEVSAEHFAQDLDALGNVPLHVTINSPGGDVFAGLAIYNRLRAHKPRVTVEIAGIAASMASVIAMAGDHVSAARESMVMIHNPGSIVAGDQGDFEKAAKTLGKVKALLVDAYLRKAKLTRAQLIAAMDAETWFTAEEAQTAGFVDELIEDDLDMAACVRGVNLNRFHNLPQSLKEAEMAENAELDQLKAEQERVRQVTSLFAVSGQSHGALLAKCIAEGVSVDDAHQRLMAAVRADNDAQIEPTGHSLITDSDGRTFYGAAARSYSNVTDDTRKAAVDTLAMRMGASLKSPHPSALHGDLARMSVAEMDKLFSRPDRARSFRGAGSWFAQPSSDLPAITLDAANVLAGTIFAEAERTDQWTRTNTTTDFKPRHAVQSDIPSFPLVRENEEVEYGKVSDKSESNAPATYGLRIALTRQMLLNGEVETVGRLVTQASRAALSTQLDTLYDAVIANPTMNEDATALFHADHSNLGTSGSALDGGALGDALKAMRKQTGLGGRLLGIRPRFLIVPAALEVTARQLINSNTDPSASAADVANPWKDFLEVIVEPRLDADSETAWYLAASPTAVDTFEQLYIQGPTPAIEEYDNEGGVLGTTWLMYFDHGAAALDYRGLYKATGAA